MSFPQDAVVENSELPLGSLVDLMRIAANDPHCTTVALALPWDYRKHIGCLKPLKESKFDYMDRRQLRLNELCKEALPYMTNIYEMREERDKARSETERIQRALDSAKEANEKLRATLYAVAPHLFEDYEN